MSGSCRHEVAAQAGLEQVFTIDTSSIVFGSGALAELGETARNLKLSRVALFTDKRVAQLPCFETARRSLAEAGVEAVVYDEVEVEPTDRSFLAAARFASEGRFDGYISVGGGSVIDTCKAALLYATYPADLLAYVNVPIGRGEPIPGPLPPHIACPTTAGTGSECTGMAVFDLLEQAVKTAVASRLLRPTLAIIDPDATRTLPREVVAAAGFDVLSHAIESYTARPFNSRPRATPVTARSMSQGCNGWSDLGSMEALRLGGRYLVRAYQDPNDDEARSQLAWAAALAGIAFGNAGVHLPHGMSYAVAGLVRDYRCSGYPQEEAMVPHGMSVILNAPSVVRFTAAACPERHLEAARALGADVSGAGPGDAGEVLAKHLLGLMRATGIPAGLSGVGYGPDDLEALAVRAMRQKRLVDNAPRPVSHEQMRDMFAGALHY
jgi:hydroxyacid-oxoacid transhydrogenase